MKLSSSTSCGCRFCCCCYCWIIMLLMCSSIVHVSPVVTNVNNNNNNNDYLHLQEQQQRQLRSISATMKVKTTTPTTSIRIASNWFDSKTYEAMHSFATKEEKTASKTLVLMPEWTTFTIFTTGRFFTPFTTTLTVHSTAATTLSSDISTNAVSITNMTATKSREQYFISEKSSTTANGAFIMASDEMQSKQVQKTEHNSIRTHKTEQNNMIETKSTSSYNCTTKTTTTKGDKISNNINGSTASTTIVSNTSSDGNVATNPSSSQITDDVGQGNLIEKPTGRHTRHQEHKVVTTIPLESIPLYSITLEQQQQHRQNTEHRNNKKDNYRQDVATSTSSSRTVTITKASKSKRTERTNAIQQPLNQLRRPLLVTATTPSSLLQRYARQAADAEQSDKCRMFVEGDPAKNEFYSPEFPNNYTKNINCTRVIVAPKGQIIRLDFRNSFHIEYKEECKFDFLEIRDGQYGFSTLIGNYCGRTFPPEITSKERYLWLHFHSDESIEYQGFTAVYEFIDRNRDAPSTDLNCTIEKDGFEGFINSTDVPQEIRETVIRNKIPLDCMWRIQVQDKWKIQVTFLNFKLSKPNDCEVNFLDIFPEQTVMPMRVKNFCGSAGEGITSDSNILHMRFYAEQVAINSTFSILFTAFRDRGSGGCLEGEYDCEDATCIDGDLRCNGRSNCKFLWDEEGCKTGTDGQKEHMIIIITVFGLILGGMVITFLVNCIRKIMHDQKIIRQHIRQSKESKLDEMGRHSKARSRDNLSALVSPRQKHSQTSLQILDDVSNRYYREVEAIAVQSAKEKDRSILRHQQHDMIVQTSLYNTDDSSTSTITAPPQTPQRPTQSTATVAQIPHPRACDMSCQTRESLFATSSFLCQKSITPSLNGGGSSDGRSERGTIESVPPPPRFSTFGYETQQQISSPTAPLVITAVSRRNMHVPQESIELKQRRSSLLPQHQLQQHDHQQQQYQQQQQQQHLYLRAPQELCHHHHQHQQHLQQKQQTLPHYQQRQHIPQQQQHHHIPATVVSSAPSAANAIATAISAGHKIVGSDTGKSKPTKIDESKVFIDIRNSAPDVIIMTSH